MIAADKLEQHLERWREAGLLDSQSAGRIRDFEISRESPGMRWPVIFAIAFGSLMVGAGVLLFVAAHWEDLSPTQRFLLVLAMISGFHLAAGALMARSEEHTSELQSPDHLASPLLLEKKTPKPRI